MMIIPMAVKQRCVALDRSSQLCVARWAVNTAMVVEFFNKPHLRHFTQAECRALMDGEVSNVSGAHVWIGCFANTNDGAKGTMSSPKTADGIVAGHVTVVALGQFVVQVFVERRLAGYGPLAAGPGPWER